MNRLFRTLSAAIVVVSIVAPAAFAQHAGKGPAKSQDGATEEVTVNASGQQAAVDPQTGKVRPPTNEEIKQLTDALKLNDSVEGLTPVTLDNGAKMVDLQDRMQNVAVAKVNADGTVSQGCVKNSKQAAAFVKSKPASKNATDKKAAPANSSDSASWEVK